MVRIILIRVSCLICQRSFGKLDGKDNNYVLAAIPLVDSSNELLCIQFHTDPSDSEEDFTELSFKDSISLLNEYLDVVRLDPQVGISLVKCFQL